MRDTSLKIIMEISTCIRNHVNCNNGELLVLILSEYTPVCKLSIRDSSRYFVADNWRVVWVDIGISFTGTHLFKIQQIVIYAKSIIFLYNPFRISDQCQCYMTWFSLHVRLVINFYWHQTWVCSLWYINFNCVMFTKIIYWEML